MMEHRAARAWCVVMLTTLLVAGSGCSLKRIAVGSVGNMLAEGGSTYAADDDPELIAQALPFGLKLIESLLAEVPDHPGLLLAATRGFTQYGYAFVAMEADEVEDEDLARATAMRDRARRLFLRARDYGVRGLEARHSGLGASLRTDPRAAVRAATQEDVAMLYWTAAAWGSAISISKHLPRLVADQLIVEAMLDRALELDEAFDHGAIHSALIGYEVSRQGMDGDPVDRARAHFERAVELTNGQAAGPYVSYAENVMVRRQDRAGFERLLEAALAIDRDARPQWRLPNILMQRRARWLLRRTEDLFVDQGPASDVNTYELDPH